MLSDSCVLSSSSSFIVIQDDVVIASGLSSIEECKKVISDTLELQKMRLMLKKRLLKKLLKKNIPLNTSSFSICSVCEVSK